MALGPGYPMPEAAPYLLKDRLTGGCGSSAARGQLAAQPSGRPGCDVTGPAAT